MKKPKYTRNPVFPSNICAPKHTLDDRADMSLRIIYYYESSRNHSIELFKGAKKLKRKDINSLLLMKRIANENIKREKKTLKSIQSKIRYETAIPIDIFQLKFKFVDQETIELVRKSPEGMKHLESAYADYKNSPFRDMFRWFAFSDPYNTSRVFIGITVPNTRKSFNKIKAYREVFDGLRDKYVSRHFAVSV